jgi:hypothetical protein
MHQTRRHHPHGAQAPLERRRLKPVARRRFNGGESVAAAVAGLDVRLQLFSTTIVDEHIVR